MSKSISTAEMCSNLTIKNHMMASCSNDYNYGSTCVLWCEEGYELEGSGTVTCEYTASGVREWTPGGEPICQGIGVNI